MSTRSVILVTGTNEYKNSETIRLYKHSDGYPTGNLSVIAEAIERSEKQTNESNERWKEIRGKSGFKEVTVEQLTGNIIGAATNEYGMGARLEERFNEELKPMHLGFQWDVEWMYVIDVTKKTVSVYRGSFKSGIQAGYTAGTVDPVSYVECLREECKDGEKKETLELMERIDKTEFKVSKPGIKPKGKASKKRSAGKPDLIIYSNK